jgi:hypothetical protein
MTELAFPEITTAPALAAPATIKATVLAQFAATEASLHTLAAKYRDVAYNVATTKGMNEAREARRDLRENGRFLVERAERRIKADVNDLKKTMADEVDRLVAIVRPVEEAIDAQIKAREEALAAEKAERERIEAERRAKHEAGLATIRGYLTRCQERGMTSERIAAGIAALEAVSVGAEWEDFEVAATTAKGTTLAGMRDLYAAALVAEEEARQREAQRIENARVAAELAAERKRIADEAAEVKRQAIELQRKINEQAELEAKAERDAAAVLAAQRAESERLEALAAQKREAAEHAALEAERIAELEAGAPKPGDEPLVDAYLPVSAPAVRYEAPAAVGWVTLAQAQAMVKAERELCIAACKAVADEVTPEARMGALECWRVLALANGA